MNLKMSQNWGIEDTSDDRLSIQKNVVLFLTLNMSLIDITQRLTFELKTSTVSIIVGVIKLILFINKGGFFFFWLFEKIL